MRSHRPPPLARRTLLAACLAAGGAGPLTAQNEPEQEDANRAQRGFTRFTFKLGDAGYNRIEGVPFQLGPVFQTPGPAPFRLEALLTVRSDNAINTDQVGFDVVAGKFFGPRGRFQAGVTGFSEMRPIETVGINSIDNSISAIIFHEDYRDYFDRLGFTVFGGYRGDAIPVVASAALRVERHRAVPAGRPGSVFDSNVPWRNQVLAGEGTVRRLELSAELDTRTGRRFERGPGWFVGLELDRGLGGDLVQPEAVLPDDRVITDTAFRNTFTAGTIDLRRYNEAANLTLNLRFVAAGTLGDDPLPPQYQHIVGGRGTFPGLSHFAFDCGARAVLVTSPTVLGNFFPLYGCDRAVLAQAELEGYLGFRIGDEEWDLREPSLPVHIELVPKWMVFLDAAQAWAQGDIGPYSRLDHELAYDGGGGILFGDLGFYVAVPFDGDDRDPLFVVRLGRRF